LYKYFEEHPEEEEDAPRKKRTLDEQLALALKISEQSRFLDKAA
jgi:hypothetical protein